VNYAGLLQSALVALLRNKMRSILTVLGITIGIAAVICVVAIGKAGQARVEQQLNNLGDNFVWIEAGGRAVNGVRTGTHDTKTLVMADAIAIKNQISPHQERFAKRGRSGTGRVREPELAYLAIAECHRNISTSSGGMWIRAPSSRKTMLDRPPQMSA